MSGRAAARVRGDLRVLLRHARSLPSHPSSGLSAFILQQFRAGMVEAQDKGSVKALRWRAKDAAAMVVSTAEKRRLIDEWAGEKMTQSERMKLSAYRVGLQMPETYEQQQLKEAAKAVATALEVEVRLAAGQQQSAGGGNSGGGSARADGKSSHN
jgi:hypothetical protein